MTATRSRARAVLAEQVRPDRWPARIQLTVSREMKRALDLARVEDGIEVTRRARAMIALYQEDPRFRARVDKRARDEDMRLCAGGCVFA
jgi:hypothetical protein